MKYRLIFCVACLWAFIAPGSVYAQPAPVVFTVDFFGDQVVLETDETFVIPLPATLNKEPITQFARSLQDGNYKSLVNALLAYKQKKELDDWLYYQLIRKTAQQISPKKENYFRYTLYKWFLLTASGYGATVKASVEKLLLYVHSDEMIYNIPYYLRDGEQYVCLNYHDYGSFIDFEKEPFTEAAVPADKRKPFSYRVHQLPDFPSSNYEEKDIRFQLSNNNEYRFRIKLNRQVQTIFANYPVVDYESYFNIPLSKETYQSLIPSLKKQVAGLSQKSGVDYLMRFTRYAFLFVTDTDQYGDEKRLTPEQTLLSGKGDCDDRAALFFYLVKEIYNLPMIVLSFPEHITIAVKFDKPVGTPIMYNGERYSVCEPTPQKNDLRVGQLIPALGKQQFEVAYAYHPSQQ